MGLSLPGPRRTSWREGAGEGGAEASPEKYPVLLREATAVPGGPARKAPQSAQQREDSGAGLSHRKLIISHPPLSERPPLPGCNDREGAELRDSRNPCCCGPSLLRAEAHEAA